MEEDFRYRLEKQKKNTVPFERLAGRSQSKERAVAVFRCADRIHCQKYSPRNSSPETARVPLTKLRATRRIDFLLLLLSYRLRRDQEKVSNFKWHLSKNAENNAKRLRKRRGILCRSDFGKKYGPPFFAGLEISGIDFR